jgi:XTP/dITP diphosphohydrolase
MKFIFGTFNTHKHTELGEIIPEISFADPSYVGLTPADAFPENGTTFFQNAFGKAKHLWDKIQQTGSIPIPVLADDSGICVDALGGAPGIFSARFGYDDGIRSDTERNHHLLTTLGSEKNRAAHYVCCMVLYYGNDSFIANQAIWEGVISQELSEGKTGFGYDPLFYLPGEGLTVAEISKEKKAKISHRAKAVKGIEYFLSALPSLT